MKGERVLIASLPSTQLHLGSHSCNTGGLSCSVVVCVCWGVRACVRAAWVRVCMQPSACIHIHVAIFFFSGRIFVNRSLTLENIKCYGFDMDYTMASRWREKEASGLEQMAPDYSMSVCACVCVCMDVCVQYTSPLTTRAWASSWSGTGWCQSDTPENSSATPTTPAFPHGRSSRGWRSAT